jgi:hypothetical protein
MFNRREFMRSTSAAALLGPLVVNKRRGLAADDEGRKKIAVITTLWRYLSHAQHMGDRFLVGYPHQGEWHQPDMDVVSLYVDQTPEGDQSEVRAQEYDFQVYPNIAEALQCGGDTLAVDAVIIIGEHGVYPRNEKGQILYPRYDFLQQVVEVFQRSSRSVPVFNDKHLSYSMEQARQMVAWSKRLGFPFLAGSSLPVTWRLPEVELPLDCEIEEALMVGVGSSDPMDYHALEAMQCMVERRRGGETGVKAVQLIEGDAVWAAGKEGRWSMELLTAALSRSDLIMGETLVDARPQDLVGSGILPSIVEDPAAYLIERDNGLTTTLLMLNGAVGDFTFAARVRGIREVQSTQFYLPPTPNVTYSAALVSKIEEMIETGKAPYPVERTLIVSGMLESCLESRISDHTRLETPHLNVRYRAPRESQFCRA